MRRTGLATALVAVRWWPRNRGHVLVVPDAHHENLYDLPSSSGHAVHDLVREVAIAIRATYGCDGTSVRQHNEPVGNQDVWHYHVHVFPRYFHDRLYSSPPLAATGHRQNGGRTPTGCAPTSAEPQMLCDRFLSYARSSLTTCWSC